MNRDKVGILIAPFTEITSLKGRRSIGVPLDARSLVLHLLRPGYGKISVLNSLIARRNSPRHDLEREDN